MNAIRVSVDGALHIPRSERRPKVDQRLWLQLRFDNPEFDNLLRFGKNTDGVPEHIHLVESDGRGGLVLPRGAVGIVRAAAAEEGELVAFEDHRLTCTPVSYALRTTLRDYQEEAAAALLKYVQAVVVMAAGSGKSLALLAAIARTRQPALIVVNTRDLVVQWRENIVRALGLEAGVIAEGKVVLGDITVATIQTLSGLDEATMAAVAARFGCVAVDECHHSSSGGYRAVLARFPAKYRFGVTATPEREDDLTDAIALVIGPEVYRRDAAMLLDSGHLIAPRIEPVFTTCSPKTSDFTDLVNELSFDAERNERILGIARREASLGHTVLVLTGRVEHADRLARQCSAGGVLAAALTSGTPKKLRTQTFERFREGVLRIVFATSLADEGLDVPRLSRLILATPARAEGRTIQRLGRLMRPHPGKDTPVLYDIVDEHPIAKRQFRERLRAYRTVLGKDAVARAMDGAT